MLDGGEIDAGDGRAYHCVMVDGGWLMEDGSGCTVASFIGWLVLRTPTGRPAYVAPFRAARPVPPPSIMEKSRDLRVRGFHFVVGNTRLCRTRLVADPIMRRLAYQLLDAAGSVGSNLEESAAGQTKPDFIAKQFIALKEARESRFWLRVISAAYPQLAPALRDDLEESNEIVAMLTSSVKTARSNPNR